MHCHTTREDGLDGAPHVAAVRLSVQAPGDEAVCGRAPLAAHGAMSVAADAEPMRVALYSHDTQGLGHVRRNLILAGALARIRRPVTALLICGVREACAFQVPPNVDCLTLPGIGKNGGGEYHARHLTIPYGQLINLRAEAIRSAVSAFRPHLFIVDKVPLGLGSELAPTLATLRRDPAARCVLGLREIMDEPQVAREEWMTARGDDTVGEYYDQVWVYGDRKVYDTVASCGFSEATGSKTHYTGYLNPRELSPACTSAGPDPLDELGLPEGRLVLCCVGGGQDGFRLAESFLQSDFGAGTNGVVVTGPFMPAQARRELRLAADRRAETGVLEFVTEPFRLFDRADRVISMGGYNTVCELLSFDRPTLIVPRVRPRAEQLVRARIMERLELSDCLHPDDLTPTALSVWMTGDVRHRRPAAREIDFNGVSRLGDLATALLGTSTGAMMEQHVAGE